MKMFVKRFVNKVGAKLVLLHFSASSLPIVYKNFAPCSKP